MSKHSVKTELAIEYTFDCQEMAKPKMVTSIFGAVYFAVFLIVGIYTIYKYNSLDENIAEPVQVCVMKLFCCLLILCLLNSLVDFLFMANCPWTLETVKQSNFLESCKQGFQDIIDSVMICLTMLVVIGYGVTRNDLTTF